jgi:hypothetical protein
MSRIWAVAAGFRDFFHVFAVFFCLAFLEQVAGDMRGN